MTQKEIRKSIDELNRSIGECREEAIILSSTATIRNVTSLFKKEIDNETFHQNGMDINKLLKEFTTKCRCGLR